MKMNAHLPTGCDTVVVEAWGAGGGGGAWKQSGVNRGGGGGGGVGDHGQYNGSAETWLTVSGADTGPGIVALDVAANPATVARTAVVHVGTEAFSVAQAGQPCTFSLSPAAAVVPQYNGDGFVDVVTQPGCPWSATLPYSFVTITSGGSGVGPGRVSYHYENNSGNDPRSAQVTIGGAALSVTQLGGSGLACTFTATPARTLLPAFESGTDVEVVTQGTCPWAMTSNVPWLTLGGGAYQTASRTIHVTAAPNTSVARTGTVTLGGQTVTLTQAGVRTNPDACVSLAPASAFVGSTNGTGSIEVLAPAGCAWTVNPPGTFVTVTSPLSGTGNGLVTYAYQNYTGVEPRAASLTIGGEPFVITQVPLGGTVCTGGSRQPGTIPCDGQTFSMVPVSDTIGAGSNAGYIYLATTESCSWTARSDTAWLPITTCETTATGGSVRYEVTPNPSTEPRSATLSMGGTPYAVLQAGTTAPPPPPPTCVYSVYPPEATVGWRNSGGTLAVFATPGCGWTAVSERGFVHITGNATGTGKGYVTYSVDNNTTFEPRVGILTVAGRTIYLTQAPAGDCTYQVTPQLATIGSGNDIGTFSVTTGEGCYWSASSPNGDYLHVLDAAGVGPGTVRYQVDNNTGADPRVATLSVAGQTVTVIQAAVGNCAYAVTPTTKAIDSTNSTWTVDVSTGAGCPWTGESLSSYLHVLDGTSRSGPGVLTFSADNNTAYEPRAGLLRVAFTTVSVQQAGRDNCTYQVSPTDVTETALGGTRTYTVTAPTGCPWTAASQTDFLHVVAGATGSGPGAVEVFADNNTGFDRRSGTLIIANATVTVAQTGRDVCSLVTVYPGTITIGAAPQSGAVTVEAEPICGWAAESLSAWLQVSPTAGTGAGTVTFTAEANVSGAARTGALRIAGQIVTITQLAELGPPPVTDTVRYYHTDAIGSVRLITDEAGAIVERHDYLPFGEEWQAPDAASPEPRRFAGKERDPETGLDYFGARYLEAGIGRFTAVDPISVTEMRLVDPQRLNRYAYGRNSPLRFIDPTGLDIITYDESGNEIEREKQSRWHNFWNGDSYRIATASGTFNLAEALTPLSGGQRYRVVSGAETSQLVDSFLANQSPISPGQTLSYTEIANRAINEWNWKVPLNGAFGPNALFMLDGLGQRSDYLGNVAFGYLMNAWGSSTFAAKWGGAAFNLYDSFRTGANPFKGSLFTGYDDPRDFAAINVGAALYGRRAR